MENVPEISTLPSVRIVVYRHPARFFTTLWQIIRFGIVGFLNATIDLLTLNMLSFFFPAHNSLMLLSYNTVAYTLGAVNSYILNKYWTFRHKRATTGGELLRFVVLNIVGILCNDTIFWAASSVLHHFIVSMMLWVNLSKFIAIIGTAIVSYMGMRLWVFTKIPAGLATGKGVDAMTLTNEQEQTSSALVDETVVISSSTGQTDIQKSAQGHHYLTNKSLSVVLPAYNEEEVIAKVVRNVVDVLTPWVPDFEVIVVNDGSKDDTKAVVAALAAADSHVLLVNHEVNQGYGSALVSGFSAASKELSFFTDADGQFDIHDIAKFFSLIEKYDAVLGYRIDRQDPLLRKLNAWGWKMLVNLVFGVNVRDVDCAFKLYHTEFVHRLTLETRGAMINAEMLYKLKRYGYSYTQIGVRHLPRTTGRATGAKVSVILRAIRELFIYSWKWRNVKWA